ncbi:MAG: undecaprenyldiphospho-muramoylpentapeptide beta-N-acetylglucosaminyltransferase [Sandaracinaceae bacterium]|nr:undecaprenyldiphospho-muramoylpentapeptide beta-N-acetylglucosaminyltransferase [Sandaracinaceae bacterium]
MTIRSIMVAGGGTGGHLFPGMAVVEEIRRRIPDVDVTFVGTERGIEARVLPERGERLELIEVKPLKGRTAAELTRSLIMLPGAFSRAHGLLSKHRPDLVIGVGGYASGPMLVAAAARGIPTAILEQNAHVGLTNRLLAPIAGRAYVAFDAARAQLGRKARLLGNPVRRAFVDAARAASSDPEGFEARARTVLVLGGSQGAKALNEAVPAALAKLDLAAQGLRVVHQTGASMRDEVAARYAALGVDAEVTPFVEDMARAYSSSALVIARAGATTLAEVCAIGRPSILVPYPHAADDHQAKNALALELEGAAVAIRESALNANSLATAARELLEDLGARQAMAEAARRHGRPDAAAAIVDDLFAWLGGPVVEAAPEVVEEEEDEDDGRQRFAAVDFTVRRQIRRRALRDTQPPPPAYLQVLVPASAAAES